MHFAQADRVFQPLQKLFWFHGGKLFKASVIAGDLAASDGSGFV
jgi:hypothetical protein